MPPPTHRKFWLDLDGNLLPVHESHEEFANAMGLELEDLLAQGWLRIQNVPPPYIYLDFHLPLNARQAKAVVMLFQNRFEQVVIEFRCEARSFRDGEEAMAWVMGRV